MGDRERERERQGSRDGSRPASSLGKRQPEERELEKPELLHFRLLVHVKKAGSVIGKGGDFIHTTKDLTGAKVAVDKQIPGFEERVVHVSGFDDLPAKPMARVQQALLRTAERILGEEGSEGAIKMPHQCTLRMLLYPSEVDIVMGKRGQTINDIRNKSGAAIKLTAPSPGIPLLPCCELHDEVLTLTGSPEETLAAVKLVSDKIRDLPPLLAAEEERLRGADRDRRERDLDRSEPRDRRDPDRMDRRRPP